MARKVISFICLFGGFIFPSVLWTYENVALNKAAWQKIPHNDKIYPASLAVDGRKSNLSLWGGECIVSKGWLEAEWRVDLGKILSLHHICVQYVLRGPVWDQKEFETAYFLGFSIYLSNTTEKEDGILCFQDTNYSRSTIPNPANITCPYHGRYVIYYNNRTHRPFPDGYSEYAYNDLCEVEVYGCPTPGYYGLNCSSKCPRNCQEGNCDITEGTCLGCIEGYTGDLCDEECDGGNFGQDCTESCGMCLVKEQCHHINGTCLNGCDPGYQGINCTEDNKKFCSCLGCQGRWISKSAFYKHQSQYLNEPSGCVPKYPWKEKEILKDEKFRKPIFPGSHTSVLEAVTKHMYIFCMNHGMSKSAVSDSLACEKSSLPQPNYLPQSFKEARDLISPLLIPLEKYDACINDCVLYRNSKDKDYSNLLDCPVCGEPRTKNNTVQKKFNYMPIGPRLSRWFGTANLCQLIYADKLGTNGNLKDIVDGKMYKSWYALDGVFEGVQECHTVPLSLFTDGVNPNKHMTSQKSMWPMILTWISLPVEIRQLLGPMLLVGIIPSGIKGSEPKTLEPYLEVLTDELLILSECPVYSAYEGAPVKVKVALLQYLCDIPAFSKLLHLSGHGALRSCPYCQEVGHRCGHLNKTIHISNRRFLESDHPLRSEDGFGVPGHEKRRKPAAFEHDEEVKLREEYDGKRNKSQKAKMQKETGLKGKYTLLRLPYHKRVQQMQPDGMHTLADFISHILEMLSGKLSTQKVKNCEKSFGRFDDVWREEGEVRAKTSKRPTKKQKTEADTDVMFDVPWALTKDQLKKADQRASQIQYSQCTGITPGPHFSKPWTLRTMSSKLQFITTGGLQWCIKGFLPPRQEKTLYFLLDTLKKIISPSSVQTEIQSLQDDVHYALSLIERDFPLSLQNLTTHLVHHIVDGLEDFGPVYGRWLFPYERANGWISRQCLRKGVEESTVMETYVIYDWCVHMVLSQQFRPADFFQSNNKLVYLSEKLSTENVDYTHLKKIDLPSQSTRQATPQMIDLMLHFYVVSLGMNVLNFSETVRENQKSCEFVDKNGRMQTYTGKEFKRRHTSVVKVPCAYGHQFGETGSFLFHRVNDMEFTWVVVDVFPIAEKDAQMFKCERKVLSQRLIPMCVLSKPLTNVRSDDATMWVLEDF